MLRATGLRRVARLEVEAVSFGSNDRAFNFNHDNNIPSIFNYNDNTLGIFIGESNLILEYNILDIFIDL